VSAKIAVSKDQFAEVDEVDWGFAYYLTDWKLTKQGVRGTDRGRPVLLHEYVGQRMGLPRDQAVAFKDGNPLNCTRDNLYATDYVWKEGTVVRSLEVEDEKGVKSLEKREDPGWLYGNVGVCQNVGRDTKWWTLIHLESGLSLTASWPTLARAKYAVEVIHSQAHLGELDHHERFTKADYARWRAILRDSQSVSAGDDAAKPGPPPPNRFAPRTTASRKRKAAAATAPSKPSSSTTTTPARTRRRGGGSSSTTAADSASKASRSSRSRKKKKS
jgi:hypothetical protein